MGNIHSQSRLKETSKLFLRRQAVCLSVVFLVLIFLAGFAQKKAEAAPDSSIYFDPASLSSVMGGTFTLDARIDPGSNLVYGVDAAITFDPSKVHVVGIARNTSAFPNNDYELQNVFDNTGGTAVISVITGIISPPTINSATTIATFTFQAVGPGDISISFDEDRTIAIASGEGSSNVITASTPAQVVISGTTYNSDDFADLAAHWLSTGSGLAADVNADSAVNARDLGVMMSFWED